MADNKKEPTTYEKIKNMLTSTPKPKKPAPSDLGSGYAASAADAAKKHNDEETKKAAEGFKKGGKVKKTGKHLVHKGEVVLNKTQQQKVGTAKVKKAIEPTVEQYRRKN